MKNLSEKYIKRTKKGEGRKRKDFVKEVKEFRNQIKPEIQVVLGLMIIAGLKDKEREKDA